eukprot:1130660-Prorocentrum_minimum.AAC.7
MPTVFTPTCLGGGGSHSVGSVSKSDSRPPRPTPFRLSQPVSIPLPRPPPPPISGAWPCPLAPWLELAGLVFALSWLGAWSTHPEWSSGFVSGSAPITLGSVPRSSARSSTRPRCDPAAISR